VYDIDPYRPVDRQAVFGFAVRVVPQHRLDRRSEFAPQQPFPELGAILRIVHELGADLFGFGGRSVGDAGFAAWSAPLEP